MVSRLSISLLFGLCLFFSLREVSSSPATIPVLMWSNANFFNGQNTQDNSILSVEDISSSLRSKINSQSTSVPEIIFVFVEPMLSSEQVTLLSHGHEANSNGGALSNLKKLVETSKSSLVYPYATSSSVGDQLIADLTSTITGSVITVGKSSSLTIDELKTQLSSGTWSILNDKVTDLVVVYFNSPAIVSMLDDAKVRSNYAADDASLASVIGSIQNSEYIAIFTSNGAHSNVLDAASIPERLEQEHVIMFRDTYNQEHDLLYTTNWPSPIVEALIVMAPFLGILFLGVCCTMQIQSDLKFDAEKVILRKHL